MQESCAESCDFVAFLERKFPLYRVNEMGDVRISVSEMIKLVEEFLKTEKQ